MRIWEKNSPDGWRVTAKEYADTIVVTDPVGSRWIWQVWQGRLAPAYRWMLLAMEQPAVLARVKPGASTRWTRKWGPIVAPEPVGKFWVLEHPGFPPLVLKGVRGDSKVRHLMEHLTTRLKEYEPWQRTSAA